MADDRRHRRRRGHAARRRRGRAARALGRGRLRDRGRRGPLRASSSPPSTSPSRRRGAPTASRSSRSSPRSRRSPTPAGTTGLPYDAAADRLDHRHRHRRHRHDRGQRPRAVRARAQARLAARRAADDGQRRRRRGQHAPRPARASRSGRCRRAPPGADAIGTAMRAIAVRRRRRGRRRRRRGGADAALEGRLQRARRALGDRASRAPSTRAATAS